MIPRSSEPSDWGERRRSRAENKVFLRSDILGVGTCFGGRDPFDFDRGVSMTNRKNKKEKNRVINREFPGNEIGAIFSSVNFLNYGSLNEFIGSLKHLLTAFTLKC